MVQRIGRKNAKPPRIFLREWREFRHMTQEQLANRLGTTKATISRIETGKRDYTGGFIAAAAEALNCEPADILARDPNWPTLDDLMRTATEDQRRQARAVVEVLFRKTGT